MLELKKLYYLLGFIFLSTIVHAQDFSKETLQKLGDEELLSLFNEVENDSIIAEKVARVYLDRARKENDTIKMARGYDKLARIFHPEKNIQFADSIIFLTKNMDNITYPGLGYMLKGYEYRKIGNLEMSNKNDLLCYELAIKNNNIAHEIYISDKLITAKSFWGNKREALKLQKRRHKLVSSKEYYKKLRASIRGGIQIDYEELYLENELSSILNFVICYINLKVLDSAKIYLKEGLLKNYKYKGYQHDTYKIIFLECSIEIDYYEKNYTNVLATIDKLLTIIDKK
ncbi:MAG: hypothetical protein IIB06_09280, partial [Bacteroidetes bacterium]|nr:hypothetical protein [Bacteroidota bacterium]